jgi:hypothetical protein
MTKGYFVKYNDQDSVTGEYHGCLYGPTPTCDNYNQKTDTAQNFCKQCCVIGVILAAIILIGSVSLLTFYFGKYLRLSF